MNMLTIPQTESKIPRERYASKAWRGTDVHASEPCSSPSIACLADMHYRRRHTCITGGVHTLHADTQFRV
jgi:hypothetical protein